MTETEEIWKAGTVEQGHIWGPGAGGCMVVHDDFHCFNCMGCDAFVPAPDTHKKVPPTCLGED